MLNVTTTFFIHLVLHKWNILAEMVSDRCSLDFRLCISVKLITHPGMGMFLKENYWWINSITYSSLSNKRAAQLINFLKKSSLHTLIPSCTFINFRIFLGKNDFHSSKFWKIPTCTALFHPARLLILGFFPSYTFIPSCTIIR